MKVFDIVKTRDGAIGMITEKNLGSDNYPHDSYSIDFFGNTGRNEKSAWWSDNEGLVVIDNLASFLARAMRHPFGAGLAGALKDYPQP